MNVLMLSRDPLTRDPSSEVSTRIERYKKLADDVHIVTFTKSGGVLAGFMRVYREGNAYLSLWPNAEMLISAQDPFEIGMIGYILKKKHKAKLLLQIHTDFFNKYFIRESWKNRIRIVIARYILPFADCLQVVSRRVAQSLVKSMGIPMDYITVLPVAVDVSEFSQAVRAETGAHFVFLIASRLTREKNIPLAIKAFAELSRQNPNIKLHIVGEGPELHRLETQVLGEGIRPLVEFSKWQSNLKEVFLKADCLLITSNYEGYGRTAIEALAAGVPVVMTDVGLAGEFIENEVTGLVVPVGDKKALVGAMDRIMQDNDLRNKIVRLGRERASGLIGIEEYDKRYKHIWTTCGSK